MISSRSLLVLLVAIAAACGGKVAVDSAATGTGGGVVDPALCMAYCDAKQQMGCLNVPSLCPFDCQQELANVGVCAGAKAALVDCITHDPTATCTTHSCTAQQHAFWSCVIPETCGESAQCEACNCHNTCSGVTYETHCTLGDMTCTCSKDGMAVGTCSLPKPDGEFYLGCDLYVGCCAQFFATSH